MDNFLVHGASGPEFEPCMIPVTSVRLSSPSLARWRCLLNEMYDLVPCVDAL